MVNPCPAFFEVWLNRGAASSQTWTETPHSSLKVIIKVHCIDGKNLYCNSNTFWQAVRPGGHGKDGPMPLNLCLCDDAPEPGPELDVVRLKACEFLMVCV